MRNALPVIREDATTLKQRLHQNRMVARNHGCRCFTCWPAARPRPVGTWLSYWESIAIPSATGSRSMPRVAWRPCWTCTRPPARPYRSPRPCWPGWSRPCDSRRVLPLTRPRGNGSSRHYHLDVKVSHPLHDHPHRASTPSSKCRAPVTQKNPEAVRDFQATCPERLQSVIPPENTCPVRVFSEDESRWGLCGASPPTHGRRGPTRGIGPARLRMVLYLWGGGPDHGGALLSRIAVSECRDLSAVRGCLCRDLPRQFEPPARIKWCTHRPADAVAGERPVREPPPIVRN